MAGRSYLRSNSTFSSIYLFHIQVKETRSNEELRLAFIFLVSLLKFFTASGALVVSEEPAKYAQRVYVYIQIEIKEKRQEKVKQYGKEMPARRTMVVIFQDIAVISTIIFDRVRRNFDKKNATKRLDSYI